ncbi:MAG: YkgJ family cysteine cluster protein [Desulfobacterales bacterium]|nr:YkgJ family cysteine cluster protein [Desulfobacterales bacterium]
MEKTIETKRTILPEIKSKIYRNKMAGPNCKRCGTCCRKGGPSFHLEDKGLIETGKIPSKYLYTIRKGELALDNVTGRLAPVKTDLVKIRGIGITWTCIFYDPIQYICKIYDHRPVECRALKCWDTREIERIYNEERLTRKDLLEGFGGIWDIIETHQKRCDYHKIGVLAARLKSEEAQKDALAAIDELLRYDKEIRSLVAEKAGMDPDMMDFLFGRPLTETMVMFRIKVEMTGEKYRLVPV